MGNPASARGILGRLRDAAADIGRPVRLMEVCGTHTVALRRHGIHSLLPRSIRMLSGPGCPVCVTPTGYIDNALRLVERPDTVVATFGDMLRVPGTLGKSLALHLGSGRVRVVYSAADLPAIADGQGAGGSVVFLGVGFETTAPTIASVFAHAIDEGRRNLLLYSALRTIPPALQALIADGELAIDGFLLPGHVSAVIGADAYGFLARAHRGVPAVIAGFDALDMLLAVTELVELVRDGTRAVRNAYRRVVRPEGNPQARAVVARLFQPSTEPWRGMGSLPGASLALRPEYASLDAASVFGLCTAAAPDPPGCACAAVVRGAASPPECPLFGGACTPDQPIGPCMVASEGTCAAHFRYGEETS